MALIIYNIVQDMSSLALGFRYALMNSIYAHLDLKYGGKNIEYMYWMKFHDYTKLNMYHGPMGVEYNRVSNTSIL
jgi:hypothetical protein